MLEKIKNIDMLKTKIILSALVLLLAVLSPLNGQPVHPQAIIEFVIIMVSLVWIAV